MNPYEVIEEPQKAVKLNRTSGKLFIVLLAHRITYAVLAILGFLFYWRSDATSLGEIFGWVGAIGYTVDIVASFVGEALLGKDDD